MKAAVFYGVNDIRIEEREIREPGPGEVLVKNRAAGVCGTDVHIYGGEKGASDVDPPVVLGHEYSGEIIRVGKGVTNVQVGDHVTVDPNIYCGICDACRNGKKQMCEHMMAIGVNFDGGFAEYSTVPAAQCLKVNNSLSFEAAALSEPLACCIHGIDRAEIRPGNSVCIIGGGAIGLMMVQLAKLSGASAVILSEPVAMRREAALKAGADHVIDPLAGNVREQVCKITGTGGASVVIECAGLPVTAGQAVDAAMRGATILMFSVPSPDAVYQINQFDIFKKELTIRGSFVNPDTHQRAVNLLNSGLINTDIIITHRYGVEDTVKAIKKQTEQDSLKVIITP